MPYSILLWERMSLGNMSVSKAISQWVTLETDWTRASRHWLTRSPDQRLWVKLKIRKD